MMAREKLRVGIIGANVRTNADTPTADAQRSIVAMIQSA
jgi:hypothetical protein